MMEAIFILYNALGLFICVQHSLVVEREER